MSLDGLYCGTSAAKELHPARGWTGQIIAPLSDMGQGT